MKKTITEIINSDEVLSSEEFRDIRNFLGKSQRGLADDLGFKNKTSVSNIEHGKQKVGVSITYHLKDLAKKQINGQVQDV